MKPLNFSPLDSRVSLNDILADQRSDRGLRKYLLIVVVAFFGLIVFAMILLVVGIAINDYLTGTSNLLKIFLPLLLFLSIFTFLLYTVLQGSRKVIRLKRFALLNELGILLNGSALGYKGIIFQEGHDRTIKYAYQTRFEGTARGTELGEYNYVIGSGKHRRTVAYGYIRVDLSRSLPHMVLDAKSNNIFGRISNLPANFASSQRLSLEGDFDKYFTLYAPKHYERDALYVLTPDIMAALIDGAKSYDLEIIDNQLFIYSTVPFKLDKQTDVEKAFAMATTVGRELHEQTDFYADERIGDRSVNVVADPGRRLRKGINWVTVVIIVYVAVTFIVQMTGLSTGFFSN